MISTQVKESQSGKGWFFFTALFLFVDYGRPQDHLPIGSLRPALIVILILALYILANKGLKKSFHFKQVSFIWYFVFLLAAWVPFAVNNYFAYNEATNMLAYMPFIISVVLLVNTVERIRTLITIFICLMIYIALYSLTHGGVGSGNYFEDENDVSLFINMWLPFCYFLFLNEKGFIKKSFYLTGIIVGLAAVVVSFSRGGFVGLVCTSAVIWFFSPRKLVSLLLILIAVAVMYATVGEEYKREMATVTESEKGTGSARLRTWASAWDMFLDRPLGVGGGNFPMWFSEYQGDRFKRGMWGRAAHSLWFTLIPELGIIGILLYFKLLQYNLKDIFRIKRIDTGADENLKYMHALSLSFIASLAGFFASATFISVLYYPHYWYLTGLIVATARVAKLYLQESQAMEVKSAYGASD